MSIALVTCSNGLGHTRRLLSLFYAIKKRKITARIFARNDHIERLTKIYKLPTPEYEHFDSGTTLNSLEDGSSLFWEEQLPNLENYKLVVSDNLPDILTIRPDAWLSGSFLWHETFKNINKRIKQKHLSIFKKTRPKMIATELFAPQYLGRYSDLYTVGLYTFQNKKNTFNEKYKNDLLLSCGTGGKACDQIKNLLKHVCDARAISNYKFIWVEPTVYDVTFPKWIKPATYDHYMYRSLKAAIVRPSIGTISDLLSYRVNMFLYYEKGNLEMSTNANLLSKNAYAIDCVDASKAWNMAQDYYGKNKSKKLLRNFEALNLNGAVESADILAKHLN